MTLLFSSQTCMDGYTFPNEEDGDIYYPCKTVDLGTEKAEYFFAHFQDTNNFSNCQLPGDLVPDNPADGDEGCALDHYEWNGDGGITAIWDNGKWEFGAQEELAQMIFDYIQNKYSA